MLMAVSYGVRDLKVTNDLQDFMNWPSQRYPFDMAALLEQFKPVSFI